MNETKSEAVFFLYAMQRSVVDFPVNNSGKLQVIHLNMGSLELYFYQKVIRISLCLNHVRQVTFGFFHRSYWTKLSNLAETCSKEKQNQIQPCQQLKKAFTSTLSYRVQNKRGFPVKLVSCLHEAVNIPESQKQQKGLL